MTDTQTSVVINHRRRPLASDPKHSTALLIELNSVGIVHSRIRVPLMGFGFDGNLLRD